MRISKIKADAARAYIVKGHAEGKSVETLSRECAVSKAFVTKYLPASTSVSSTSMPAVSLPAQVLSSSVPANSLSTKTPLERAKEAAGLTGPEMPVSQGVSVLAPTFNADEVADELVESVEFVTDIVLDVYARRVGVPKEIDTSEITKISKEQKNKLRSQARRGAPYLHRLTGGPAVGAALFGIGVVKIMMVKADELKKLVPPKQTQTAAVKPSPAANGVQAQAQSRFLESLKRAQNPIP